MIVDANPGCFISLTNRMLNASYKRLDSIDILILHGFGDPPYWGNIAYYNIFNTLVQILCTFFIRINFKKVPRLYTLIYYTFPFCLKEIVLFIHSWQILDKSGCYSTVWQYFQSYACCEIYKIYKTCEHSTRAKLQTNT